MIPNPRLRKHFEAAIQYATTENAILDGEIWSPSLTFQEIMSICMTRKNGGKIVAPSIGLYVFEILTREEWECNNPYKVSEFRNRYVERIRTLEHEDIDNLIPLKQTLISSKEEAEQHLAAELAIGGEGCMLRDPHSHYKWGRHTLKENALLKLKFIDYLDAQVIGYVQAERMNEGTNRDYDAFGVIKSVNSKYEKHKIEALGALMARD